MGRPRREVGDWGKVTVTRYVLDEDGKERLALKGERSKTRSFRARTKVRDLDGKLRDVERFASTEAEARKRLHDELTSRTSPAPLDAPIKPSTTLLEAGTIWLANVTSDGDHSPNTLRVYGSALRRHLVGTTEEPSHLAHLCVRDVKRATVTTRLREVRKESGDGAAKMAKTVLTDILDLAVDHDAIPGNPARGLPRQRSRRTNRDTRALAFTRKQRDAVVAFTDANARAKARDLPDLIAFLAGTGARIGEACALRWSHLDFGKVPTAKLGPLIVRVPGKGLMIQEHGKSATSNRTVALSKELAARLLARKVQALPNEWDVVFPSPRGRLRDLSNTGNDIRDLLTEAGHPEATAHTFRKTVATLLTNSGKLTEVEVANHLGHARASLTKDIYVDRRSIAKQAAEVL